MNIIEAIHGRRSIRAYRDEPLPRSLVEDLVWAAVQAPTPALSDDTPLAVAVIEGRERLAAYGTRAQDHARATQSAPLARRWAERSDFEVFWGAPVAVMFCARAGDRETPFDCCRAGQNLVLVAHARGLGSCWVGAPLPWLSSTGVADELGLQAGFDPVVVVVLGHPNESPRGRPRPRPSISWCPPAHS